MPAHRAGSMWSSTRGGAQARKNYLKV
jgi:hypothetical protein